MLLRIYFLKASFDFYVMKKNAMEADLKIQKNSSKKLWVLLVIAFVIAIIVLNLASYFVS